jgi:hypothetical protein
MRATGRSNHLIKSIGEFSTCAELARRGYIATPFAGNVPEFDLVYTDSKFKARHLQVKATRTQWQFNAGRYIHIQQNDDGTQEVTGKVKLAFPSLVYVFVQVGSETGKDKFFFLRSKELQKMIYKGYKAYLAKHKKKRPQNPKSTHCAINANELGHCRNKWELLGE